ncbi:MAG: DUF3617 family protein [Gammaproteobacteria bacterium]
MRTAIRRTAIALGIAAAAAATFVYAENLKLRTGEWDFTLTGLDSVLGGAAAPTPQARARLAQPMRYKSCITDEDLAHFTLAPPADEDENCKVTSSNVTGQAADISRTCSGEKERTEKMHVDAVTPESLKATIDMTSARGAAHLTIVGTWIGAKCTDSD